MRLLVGGAVFSITDNYDIPLPLLQQNSITHTNTVNYIYKQNNEL
jgi:hypothetical protein